MFGRERIQYKSDDDIRTMRRAGLVVSKLLATVRAEIRPGVTTADLDAVAAEVLRSEGATSNFLGYYGYPATICVSVNDTVVHGIPGDQIIQPGDIVSVDGGAIIDGWHGDSAFSVVVDPADPADVALSETTERAMWAGLAAFATGERVGDIGAAIEGVAIDAGKGYGVLQDYVGHGIGTAMHQPPDVLNYATKERGPKLRDGLCVAIEPMFTMSGIETEVLADDWTVITTNGARAAHWEHTIARHSGGVWVLTAADGGAERLAEFGVTVVPLD